MTTYLRFGSKTLAAFKTLRYDANSNITKTAKRKDVEYEVSWSLTQQTNSLLNGCVNVIPALRQNNNNQARRLSVALFGRSASVEKVLFDPCLRILPEYEVG